MTRNKGINRTKGKLIVFSLMAAVVVLVAVLSPVIAPFDPYAQNLGNALLALVQNILREPIAMGAIYFRVF